MLKEGKGIIREPEETAKVLILILMEYAQRVAIAFLGSNPPPVLILILMEYAQSG